MDSDEEDFVFVGTPLEREEDMTSRKKKSVAEASGTLRSLPPWKQEVRDEEGRRRFHGAFTGGFSAGYYNTAGSKEGWSPLSFTSSRKNRAGIKQQSILNFLDDDEKAEMEDHALGASYQFDTFGFTATELARRQAEKEVSSRPAGIPGPVPDELIHPTTESMGKKLLLKMGWRHGRAIKDLRTNSHHDVRREARKAFLALSCIDDAAPVLENAMVHEDKEDDFAEKPSNADRSSLQTPVYVHEPKDNLYGLGFDPYKHAPEFREKQRLKLHGAKDIGNRKPFSVKDGIFSSKSGKVAPGFGIGALEEADIEDEDVYASGFDYEVAYVQEDEEPLRLMDDKQIVDARRMLGEKPHGGLPGFRVASNSSYQLERFDPPVTPKDFVPQHKFTAPRDLGKQTLDVPPPEVPPPEDNNLKLMIDGVATLLARSGKLFEDLSRDKNQSNPLFSFLSGGNGYDYYARKLWEEQQKHTDLKKYLSVENSSSSAQKLTAESRGRILGERPLERSSKDPTPSESAAEVYVTQNLSDTFTKPESFMQMVLTDALKPFIDEPAKQERFEQFLKDKYQGGLRLKQSDGAGKLSEAARARERLDFEAAAEAIEKAKSGDRGKLPGQQLVEFSLGGGLQFSSSGVLGGSGSQDEEMISKSMFPKREEFHWRPAPLLCKRFDIVDPYQGKPPPSSRTRSKLDSLIVPLESKYNKVEEMFTASDKPLVSQPKTLAMDTKSSEREDEGPLEVDNIERPVDLYKAIFSDDSDVDDEPSLNQVSDPQKKIEAANTTLSRLMAGDFLESLGKELGMEVLPEPPVGTIKAGSAHEVDKTSSAVIVTNAPTVAEDASMKDRPYSGNLDVSNAKLDKMTEKGRKDGNPLERDDHTDDSSSEYERSKKRSRGRGHHRSSDSYSSDDYEDGSSSRSRDRKKRSSRDRSRSRKLSKRKRDRGDAPIRTSHHRRDRDNNGVKKDRRR
ncbi:hypothetical protein Droror1_Dr00026778 [Drosera rotundifolia]